MTDLSGLITTDGKPVYKLECVEELRSQSDNGKTIVDFVPHIGAQEKDLRSSVDILITGGNRGGGKANTYGTPVITPTGTKRMGKLEIGDEICTPYEGIQKVSAIYEQGEQTTYRIAFDDGSAVNVMDSHRFWARRTPDEKFQELTARDIIDRYTIGKNYPESLRKGVEHYVEIPLCGEVEKQDIKIEDLPIHPLLLGFVSSTGYWEFPQRGILCTNLFVRRIMKECGYSIRKLRGPGHMRAIVIPDEKRRMITNRRAGDAYIPDEYMNATPECRLEYIRGAFVSHGKQKFRQPYLLVVNKAYGEQLAQMVRSLGWWASVTETEVEKDDGRMEKCWKVLVKAPNNKVVWMNPTRIEQARENAPKATSPYQQDILTKKVIAVTKYKKKLKFRCITVTGKHHLYLTNAYTINHNTVTMLMDPVYDIGNKHFNGIVFRKNKDDFENIINESKRWFGRIGKYNRSKDDMTWYFNSGAKLSLSIFDMPFNEFDDKYRGQQFAYIGIDELPQMPFEQFKFLLTANRNTVGVRSRILATCNPDPMSWLRKFLDWWIGKEDTVYADGKRHPELKGFIIPERDGAIRYCYMPTNDVEGIKWGDTPEEVYEQCRDEIDAAWDPEFERFGYTKTTFFVKSVTFIKASLKENKALLKNDPGYIAALLNQPPEVRAREWDGNWDYVVTGNDLVQNQHLDAVFSNHQMLGDKIKRATCDVAATGGDNCVLWLWIGWHVADVFVCRRDPYHTVDIIKAKLNEWGVAESNFTYDLQGIGQVLKGGFPDAIPFNNQEAVDIEFKNLYDCKKSQCAYKFAERTRAAEWSIEPSLLNNVYLVGKTSMTLRDILRLERKCIKQDMSRQERGWCLIRKDEMKRRNVVGHSPDFFEALIMREIFDLKAAETELPDFISRQRIRYTRTFNFA